MKVFSIQCDKDAIVIKHGFGTKTISRSEIESMTKFTGSLGFRVCGYSVPGRVKYGWYYSSELKMHCVFVDDKNNMNLLRLKNGKVSVLSGDLQ